MATATAARHPFVNCMTSTSSSKLETNLCSNSECLANYVQLVRNNNIDGYVVGMGALYIRLVLGLHASCMVD